MIEGSDRRRKKTKKQLREAFTKLLRDKDLRDITVRELTECADVNRSTFYLHYKDIYDFYEQMELQVLNSFHNVFEKHEKEKKQGISLAIILDLFKFLAENADICNVILNSDDHSFLSKVIELAKPSDPKEWQAILGNVDPKLYEYHYSFITSGCIGLLKTWFAAGMKESPAEMAKLAQKLMGNRSSI